MTAGGLLLDFTVTSLLCSSALARVSNVSPEATAAAVESTKFHKDRVSIAPAHHLNYPLVRVAFESFGRPEAHTATTICEWSALKVQ